MILSHGWPLNADAWDAAALFLAEHGHRAIAHDRRGHGRSSQTWNGNEMDTYADDLACLIEHLDLTELTLVGHSTGGGEIVHYLGRHGIGRVAKLVLVSAVPPLMLRTDDNPEGCRSRCSTGSARARHPIARSSTATSPTGRSSATTATTTSRRVCATRSGCRAWRAGIAAPTSASPRSRPPTSGPTSPKVDVPTLVIHGADDQIVPFEVGGKRSAATIAGATLTVYEDGAHGLPDTERERLHADLLAFIDS